MKHFIDGNMVAVTRDDFVDLQNSPAVFIPQDSEIGKTILERGIAYIDLVDMDEIKRMLVAGGGEWKASPYDAMDRGDYENDAEEMRRERNEYRRQRDELLAACEFYANPVNWENNTVDIGVGDQEIPGSSNCAAECGEIARTAIALAKGT